MKTLKEQYNEVIHAYVNEFRKRHGFGGEHPAISSHKLQHYSLNRDAEILYYDDMRYDVDTEQPLGYVFEWLKSLKPGDNSNQLSYPAFCELKKESE